MITAQQFAKLHGVDDSAIRHAIVKKILKGKKKYGRWFLKEDQDYNPHSRGVKPAKKRKA
jgi:hypothetical protein